MKTLAIVAILATLAIAQTAPSRQPMHLQQPSASVTAPVPAQTITLTFDISSDLATALEKHRRDTYTATVNADGSTTLQPVSPTITAHIAQMLQKGYFQQVLKAYPSASVTEAQKAVTKAQAAANDAAQQAAAIKVHP